MEQGNEEGSISILLASRLAIALGREINEEGTLNFIVHRTRLVAAGVLLSDVIYCACPRCLLREGGEEGCFVIYTPGEAFIFARGIRPHPLTPAPRGGKASWPAWTRTSSREPMAPLAFYTRHVKP